MKHILLPAFAVLAIAACDPIDPAPAKPVAPKATDVCNANEVQDFVGQKRLAIDKKRIKTSVVRYLKPDSAVTLDYSEQRMNIVLDENNTVLRVMCA
jgi:hypothetical protein